MTEIAGKAAIVTGAASGIGLGIARALGRAGARVMLADIRGDEAAAAAEALRGEGLEARAIRLDVSDRAAVEEAAVEVERAFGRLDIAVNNAGISMHGVPMTDIPPADWDFVIAVNIYGVIHGIRSFVPRIRRHGGGGHVVNTASIGGLQVNAAFHTGAYSMTKYAVVALSEALANELQGTDIGVSVLCPAAVATKLHFSARSRPERLGGPTVRTADHFMGNLTAGGLSPDTVGTRVVDGIRRNEFFLFTHPETREWLEARHRRLMEGYDALDAWLRRDGRG